MDDSLLDLVNQAAQSQQWLILAIAVVLLAVPVVLKALGKSVPILDQILAVATSLLKTFAKKTPPPPAQLPENQDGVAKVVPIEDARKGPQP
jgi:hypothetical protein